MGITWVGTIQTLATTAVALVGVYLSWQAQQTNERLQAIDKQLAAQKQALVERESLDTKRLKVYEEVVSSLAKNDERMQKVSAALVNAMLDGPHDTALKTELLRVLSEAGSTPEVRADARRAYATAQTQAETQARVAQLVAVSGATFDWENYDYDLFWCESAGAPAMALAQGMRELMLQQGARGRIRVRPLSAAQNAQPGYGKRGYLVAYNDGEAKQAAALIALGEQVAGRSVQFRTQLSRQPTRWYLSAFLCPVTADATASRPVP